MAVDKLHYGCMYSVQIIPYKLCIVPIDALPLHWNGNIFILMKLPSLAALEVVKMTNSNAASDENFMKILTFSLDIECVT